MTGCKSIRAASNAFRDNDFPFLQPETQANIVFSGVLPDTSITNYDHSLLSLSVFLLTSHEDINGWRSSIDTCVASTLLIAGKHPTGPLLVNIFW